MFSRKSYFKISRFLDQKIDFRSNYSRNSCIWGIHRGWLKNGWSKLHFCEQALITDKKSWVLKLPVIFP
jgi:hypothetical protein